MRGICKLCLKEKELIKRSHIFPNFMYKGIADEKNRINIVSSKTPFSNKIAQSGAYERFILCSKCDSAIISVYERYANNHFYSLSYRENNEIFTQKTDTNGVNLIYCNNIEYTHFKLFLESLLWRASISKDKVFQNFKLSKVQEEELRKSINNSIPLDFDEFLCIMLTYQNNEKVETDIVYVNPTQKHIVSFVINQFIYIFYFDKTFIEKELKQFAINKNNTMSIIKLPYGKWNSTRESIIRNIVKIAQSNMKNGI